MYRNDETEHSLMPEQTALDIWSNYTLTPQVIGLPGKANAKLFQLRRIAAVRIWRPCWCWGCWCLFFSRLTGRLSRILRELWSAFMSIYKCSDELNLASSGDRDDNKCQRKVSFILEFQLTSCRLSHVIVVCSATSALLWNELII